VTPAEQPAAREMAFLLGTYPDVVRTALCTHEPSAVVTFAFRLDLERVGDGRGQGRGGRRAGSCADVALFVCLGRARGCDAVVEHSSVGTHVRVDWVRNLVSSPLLSTGQCTPCVEGHL